MQRRMMMVLGAMAVLCLAVVVPTASAKTSKTDKSQNKTLKSHGKTLKSHGKTLKSHGKTLKSHSKSIKKNSTSINSQSKSITDLGNSAKGATGAIAALKIIAERGDANAKTVLDSAPAIISGLTQLKDGLTAAGAGLTSLQKLATSTEYGVGQVFIAGTAAPGSFVVTPDIPDAVQQGQVTQTFVAGAPGAITLQVAVRSAESDGTGPTDPAAFCRTTIVSGVNSTTSAPTVGPNPVAPAPFYPINLKSPQTSTTETSFPFGPISSDTLTDLTVTAGGGANAVNPTGTAATAVAGTTYTVSLSCVDPTPSATDPSA